jgi:hypothetical protein
MKVANRITMREEGDPVPRAPGNENFPFKVPKITPFYYSRVKPSDNVEIRKVDTIDLSTKINWGD